MRNEYDNPVKTNTAYTYRIRIHSRLMVQKHVWEQVSGF